MMTVTIILALAGSPVVERPESTSILGTARECTPELAREFGLYMATVRSIGGPRWVLVEARCEVDR